MAREARTGRDAAPKVKGRHQKAMLAPLGGANPNGWDDHIFVHLERIFVDNSQQAVAPEENGVV